MVVSTESPLDLANIDLHSLFVKEYDDAVIYSDIEGETILHRGEIRILANGWVELPSEQLLSPESIHHIDKQPDTDNSSY